MARIKVVSSIEQTFDIDWDNKDVKLVNTIVLQSNIFNENNSKLSENITYEFTATEQRYGIISLGRKHPLSSLYKPGEPINIIIDNKKFTAKWHSSQCRIDGLTKLFSTINLIDSKFEVHYIPETNSLEFIRI